MLQDTRFTRRVRSTGLRCGVDASTVELAGDSDSLDSGDTRTFTATLLDAAGNPVTSGDHASLPVHFFAVSGGGTVEGLGTVTAENGVAEITVTGDRLGKLEIGAIVGDPELSSETLAFDVIDAEARAPAVDEPRVAFSRESSSASWRANLAWVSPGDQDWEGVLVVRSSEEAFAWSPQSGDDYSVGDSIGDGTVVYVGAGGRFDEERDPEAEHYTAFSFDPDGRFSPAVPVEAMVAGGEKDRLPAQSERARHLILITHGWDSGIDGWVSRLGWETASYILDSAEDYRDWDVWAYDWETDAGVTLFAADGSGLPVLDNAASHGEALGTALGESYDYDHVHLIGHGAGAHLVDTAATELDRTAGAEVTIHATYLDALDAAELNPGGAADWAEHYYTQETDTFAGGVDADGWVTEPSSNARNFALDKIGGISHSFPRQWYLESVRRLNAGATIEEMESNERFQGLGFAIARPVKNEVFDHDGEYNPDRWAHGSLARGIDTALALVANTAFEDDLEGWSEGGSGTVEVTEDEREPEVRMARLIHSTAEPQSAGGAEAGSFFVPLGDEQQAATTLSQSVATPEHPFELSFEYEFFSTTGTLDVVIESVVVATLEAPEQLLDARTPFAVEVTDPNLLGLAPATLEFRLHGEAHPEAGITRVNLVASDREPPTAQAIVADLSEPSEAPHVFSVTFADNTAVDVETITGDEEVIRVYGPAGDRQEVEYVEIDNANDGTPRTVTYRVLPPGGEWLPEDAGVYSIRLIEDSVGDTGGNKVEGGTLAAFEVAIEPFVVSVSWEDPDPIEFGTPLDETQLNAAADVEGFFEYEPEFGMELDAGEHELTAFFIPEDSANFATAFAIVDLIVERAAPLIEWSDPDPVAAGTPLSESQLNATLLFGDGDLAYDPPADTVLEPGVHILRVDVDETDNFHAAFEEVELIVYERSFEGWMASRPPEQLPPEGERGPGATPAGDDVANLIKYAMGVDPMDSAHADLPRFVFIEENGERYPGLELSRDPDAEVELTLQTSTGLNDWTPAEFTKETIETLPDDRERRSLVADDPIDDVESYFLRLEVELPD